MEISKKRILDFIAQDKEIIIPFYQRNYDWEDKEVKKLLDDVITNKNNEYFLGTIVLKQQFPKTTIIDGQQRISTLFLILKVISENEHLDNSIKNWISNMLRSFNFVSANVRDEDILNKIIRDDVINITYREKKSNYLNNYEFIKSYFKHYSNEINNVYERFTKIIFSSIAISDNDNVDEHLLFSQINSTGKKLTAFDLFKNHILSEICNTTNKNELEHTLENKLNLLDFVTKDLKDEKEFNDILRRYLSYINGELVNRDNQKIYDAYREFYENFSDENNKTISNKANMVFESFYKYARAFKFASSDIEISNYLFENRLIFLRDSFKTYANIIVDIILKNSTIDNNELVISKDNEKDIDEALKVLQLYKIRRTFCDMKEKNITRFIPTVTKLISKQSDYFNYAEKLYIILYHNPSMKLKNDPNANVSYRMPDDIEFKEGFINSKIFNLSSKFTRLFLMLIECYLSKNKNFILEKNAFLEHIHPQDDEKWYENGYDESKDKIVKYLHTIGNITLTAKEHNYSNETFDVKNLKIFKRDILDINEWISSCNKWTINTIIERSSMLLNLTNEMFDISKIRDNVNSNLNFLKDNSEIDAIDFSESSFESLSKNKSFFKKVSYLDKNIIYGIVKGYYIDKKGYEILENEFFGLKFKGWLVRSILQFLELPLDKNIEIDINKSLDDLKIEQLLKIHKDLLDGKEID